ncbi:unnamed protein product [Discosporangium mesarthrocarpum]
MGQSNSTGSRVYVDQDNDAHGCSPQEANKETCEGGYGGSPGHSRPNIEGLRLREQGSTSLEPRGSSVDHSRSSRHHAQSLFGLWNASRHKESRDRLQWPICSKTISFDGVGADSFSEDVAAIAAAGDDQSTSIGRDDVIKLAQSLGYKITQAQAQTMFQQLDPEESGRVGKEELIQHVLPYLQSRHTQKPAAEQNFDQVVILLENSILFSWQ